MSKAILYKEKQLKFDDCVTMTLKGWGFSCYLPFFTVTQ